jgi:hypothetical protein
MPNRAAHEARKSQLTGTLAPALRPCPSLSPVSLNEIIATRSSASERRAALTAAGATSTVTTA